MTENVVPLVPAAPTGAATAADVVDALESARAALIAYEDLIDPATACPFGCAHRADLGGVAVDSQCPRHGVIVTFMADSPVGADPQLLADVEAAHEAALPVAPVLPFGGRRG